MPVTASAATGTLTEALASRSTPLRVGLIGAGKFGTMFLSQARRLEGLHLLGIADLMPERARANLAQVDWPIEPQPQEPDSGDRKWSTVDGAGG